MRVTVQAFFGPGIIDWSIQVQLILFVFYFRALVKDPGGRKRTGRKAR